MYNFCRYKMELPNTAWVEILLNLSYNEVIEDVE